jgi:hypothetical protein
MLITAVEVTIIRLKTAIAAVVAMMVGRSRGVGGVDGAYNDSDSCGGD